ncbi:conserved protein of unknown function [Ralstonia solanacearum CMR15]|nr:conserved protein of unknown function [Ralstonia solanacearum CMR15]
MSPKQTAVHSDWQIIESLGGPAVVAKLLGYDSQRGGVQRVHNWRSRGIPSAVKLANPSLFLKQFRFSQDASDDIQPPTGGVREPRTKGRKRK